MHHVAAKYTQCWVIIVPNEYLGNKLNYTNFLVQQQQQKNDQKQIIYQIFMLQYNDQQITATSSIEAETRMDKYQLDM